jgi:hypothetical protein
MVESKARHQKGAVTAGLTVKSTPQLGVCEKLRDFSRVLDKGISLDDMGIVVLKRISKRIGIGQEE